MNQEYINKFIGFITGGYDSSKIPFWEVRLIDCKGEIRTYFFNDVERLKEYLKEDSLKDWNCYLSLLPRTKEKGDSESVEAGNIFVVDLDSEDAINKKEEIYQKLSGLDFKPSLIVISGHGLHIYFKIKNCVDTKKWKELQEKCFIFFMKHFAEFNPDSRLKKDPARVMRIPGTINVKKDPVETCLMVGDYVTYDLDNLERILQDMKTETEPLLDVNQTLPRKHIPKWLENVIEQGVNEGERDHWRFVITVNLWKRGFQEEEIKEIIREFNKRCRPPESENIVELHFKSIVKDAILFLQQHHDVDINDCEKIIQIRKQEQQEKLPVITEKELGETRPNPIKWYVDGYIPESGVVMMAGKRASYKSWGAIHMAIAIASGSPVFNRFRTQKVTVLFIDEENGRDLLKERVEKIKKGMGISQNLDNLFFTSFEGINVERHEYIKKLKDFLTEHRPCVIIVDCFRRIISTEENEATEVNRIFTEIIRPISKDYNTTWILIHHLRKGVSGRKPFDLMDELRGSSELTNYADVVLIFDRPARTDNRFILRQAKCRRSKEMPSYNIDMKWDELGSLSMEATCTVEELVEDVEICAKKIMTWLEEENTDKLTTKDVLDNTEKSGYSRATTYRALTILTEQGKIRKIKRGHYQRVIENLSDFSEEVSSLNTIKSEILETKKEVSKSLESHETNKDRDENDTDENGSKSPLFLVENNKLENSITSTKINKDDISETKYSQYSNKLLDLFNTFGEKIPKPELKDFPEEVITKWLNDGTIADFGDYYLFIRTESDVHVEG